MLSCLPSALELELELVVAVAVVEAVRRELASTLHRLIAISDADGRANSALAGITGKPLRKVTLLCVVMTMGHLETLASPKIAPYSPKSSSNSKSTSSKRMRFSSIPLLFLALAPALALASAPVAPVAPCV
jgi:hypothetical protein